MAPHQLPRNLAEAKALYLHAAVQKVFTVDRGQQAYTGEVKDVWASYTDEETGKTVKCTPEHYQYLIFYPEDGDSETVDWQELVTILLPAAGGDGSPAADVENRAPLGTEEQPRGRSTAGRGLAEAAGMSLGSNLQPSAQKPPSGKKRGRMGSNGGSDIPDQAPASKRPVTPATVGRQGSGSLPAHTPVTLGRNTRPAPAATEVQEPGPSQHPDHEAPACRTKGLPGHLKRVVAQDFMCHKNIEVNFGPHVTLISGANGSGKSAVLQALQVCLGVRASNTGRGTQLKDFIRNDPSVSCAVVKVTLWNHGPGAYDPRQYGKELTIERRIRKSGTSDYTLHGGDGQSKKLSGKELDALLDHFSIDASNPLSVITQDMARQFYGSGGNKDAQFKFEKFMEGTKLACTEERLNESAIHLNQAIHITKAKKTTLKEKEEQEAKLKDDLEKLQGVEHLKQVAASLEKVAMWRGVEDVEAAIAAYEEQRQHNEEILPKHQQHVRQEEALYTQYQAAVNDKNTELNTVQLEQTRYVAVLEDLRGALATAKHKKGRRSRDVVELRGRLEDQQGRKQDYETQLTQASNSQVDTGMVAEARRRLEQYAQLIEERKAAVLTSEEQFHALRQEAQSLEADLNNLEMNRRHLDSTVQRLRQDVHQLQQELAGMAAEDGNRAGLYGGQQVVRLQQELSRYQFRHPPIGPIGAYLSLADNRYGLAAEAPLARLLNRFICFSQQDLQTVRQLANQLGIRNLDGLVVQPNVPRHNVPRTAPPGWTALMDILRINHDSPEAATALFNTLIDSARMERVLLAESTERAKDAVRDRSMRSFTFAAPDGWQYQLRGEGTINPIPSSFRAGQAPRLGSDMSELRGQKQEALQQTQQAVQEAQQQLAEVTQRLQGMRQQKSALTQQMVTLNAEKRRAKQELQRAEEEQTRVMDDLNQHDATAEQQRIIVATQMVGDCNTAIAAIELELRAAERECQQYAEEEREAKAAFEEKMASGNREMNTVELVQEVEAAVKKVNEQRSKVSRAKKFLVECEQAAAEAAQLAEEARAGLGQVLTGAEALCSREQLEEHKAVVMQHLLKKLSDERQARGRGRRPPVVEPPEEDPELMQAVEEAMVAEALNQEAERLHRRCSDVERMAGGSREQIEHELEKLQNKLTKQKVLVDSLWRTLSRLKNSHGMRWEKMKQIKESTANMTISSFNTLMKRRHHQGRIKVDWEKRTLHPEVKLKDQTEWVKSLQQLSGGERSYTTVSLLLSIADHCEFPFHCLDEYDVFMDVGNRKVATERLLTFALEHPTRQFVLLTPQDLGVVDVARAEVLKQPDIQSKNLDEDWLQKDFVHTMRMPDPRPAGAGAQ